MKKDIALKKLLSLAACLSVSTAFAAETAFRHRHAQPARGDRPPVEEDLAAAGYELELIEVTDYVTENPGRGRLHVMINFFQHIPYLDGYNGLRLRRGAARPRDLPPTLSPWASIPAPRPAWTTSPRATAFAVPNDPTNITARFLLLSDAGLITRPRGHHAGEPRHHGRHHRRLNPYNLEIYEVAAELIPGLREDAAFAVINGNNATLVDLVPYVDGLYAETADSEAAQAYVNVIVVKPENAEADWVKALEQVIYTQKVYDLIVESGFAPTFEVPAAETTAETTAE